MSYRFETGRIYRMLPCKSHIRRDRAGSEIPLAARDAAAG
jgi:hypothetical protein